MCSAAITVTAWNRLLGHYLSDQLHRSSGGVQLVLQLGDAALGRGQLGPLGAGQARLMIPIDAVLPTPAADRLAADPKRLGDLSDWPAGLDQVQHFAAELRRVTAPPHAAPLGWQHGIQQQDSTEPGTTTPVNPGRFTTNP
jgi:hypothetical protein